MVNPTGWLSLASVWRFRDRTGHILEWEPTIPTELGVLPFSLLVLVLLVTWARRRVPVAEIVVVLAIVGFALLAFRNVLFALVLIAPVAATSLSRFTRPRPVPRAEARVLGVVSVASAAICFAVALVIASQTDPFSEARPLTIAKYLAAVEGTKRIYNNYNTAGVLLEFGGPGIELGIDGRADRYPADYTSRYFGAEATLQQWQAVLRQVEPDYAVLDSTNALPQMLAERGWRTLVQDGDYVLMAPPS
jgi:hypothetical protein